MPDQAIPLAVAYLGDSSPDPVQFDEFRTRLAALRTSLSSSIIESDGPTWRIAVADDHYYLSHQRSQWSLTSMQIGMVDISAVADIVDITPLALNCPHDEVRAAAIRLVDVVAAHTGGIALHFTDIDTLARGKAALVHIQDVMMPKAIIDGLAHLDVPLPQQGEPYSCVRAQFSGSDDAIHGLAIKGLRLNFGHLSPVDRLRIAREHASD